MTQESKLVLRSNKCARIIKALCKMYNISLQKATEIFYKSVTSEMIEKGVSDLQCRSDNYLAILVWEEFNER